VQKAVRCDFEIYRTTTNDVFPSLSMGIYVRSVEMGPVSRRKALWKSLFAYWPFLPLPS